MRKFFGGGGSAGNARVGEVERVARHSSGWKELLKHLLEGEGLRILDIGPTSSSNINYITGLGHSIYMANLVGEAAKPEWLIPASGEDAAKFDVEGFLDTNLNFSGRAFDVVILWDTLDYLPSELVTAVLKRIHDVMIPGGLMLAFFHVKQGDDVLYRYHLTNTDSVEIQKTGNMKQLHVYNNRQIENMLEGFSSYRFFLAKDNLREVIITR